MFEYDEQTLKDQFGLTIDQAIALLGSIPYSTYDEVDDEGNTVKYISFDAPDANGNWIPDVFETTSPTPDVTMKPSWDHTGG